MSTGPRGNEWVGLALIAAGVALVVTSVGGYALGARLDRALGTGTRWATIGVVVGLLVGFFDLYLVAARLLNAQPVISPRERELPESPADELEDHDEHR